MTPLKDGQVFRILELRHGPHTRYLVDGTVRVFEQEGETRYEVTANEMTTGQDGEGNAAGRLESVTVGVDLDTIVRVD